MDAPGQFMRRIKTVAVSIPCVTGPYTGVYCKISLLRSSIRISSLKGDDYTRSTTSDDDRFRDFNGAIQSMVTSNAQNDSGLFELSFHDDRYLPFEGAGAISSWRLEMANDIPQFDFETISDVILHVRYTAREAGQLKPDATVAVKDVMQASNELLQLFTLNFDFATPWYLFTSAASDALRKLDLSVSKDLFPYWVNPVGMDDNIIASFCCIDWKKNKLTIASKTATLAGDATAGWTLSIDNTSDIFPFLKKNMANKVYMAVSFAMKS